jgi:FeoB-associated Cys-rich membrane protein
MTASNWQLWLVLAIVAGAAIYVGRSFWRSMHPKKGNCGGCGCHKSASPSASSQTPLISADSIVLRPARMPRETSEGHSA